MYSTALSSIPFDYFSSPQAQLLNGILLGIDIDKKSTLYAQLINSGLIHVAVVSGMNLRLIEEFISSLLSWLPKKVQICLTIITIVFFSLLVGLEPPISRALVMILLEKIGLWFGRIANPWLLMFQSICLLLIFEPNWVSSLSFYLTYGATSGVLLFSKPPSWMVDSDYPFKAVILMIIKEVWTSIGACIGTAPIIYIIFGRIQFISIITTPLISWTLVPITISGFLLLILSPISSAGSETIAYFISPLLTYILFIASLCS